MDRTLKITTTGPHKVKIIDEHGHSACHKHSYQADEETFSWGTDHGYLEIDFVPRNHHPFTTSPPYTANGGWTNPVTVDASKPPAQYTYTIKIDGVDYDDPKVIIDSGTGLGEDSGSLILLGDPSGVRDSAKDLLNTVVSQLKSAAGGPILFKDGIDLISIDVEVDPVKVSLKIAGPKAPDN